MSFPRNRLLQFHKNVIPHLMRDPGLLGYGNPAALQKETRESGFFIKNIDNIFYNITLSFMESIHKIYYQNSNNLSNIESNSVDLIVTSPPYPMIEMWDNIFSIQNSSIKDALNNHHEQQAFEKMHQELDKTWNELFRVLKDGAFACINIGDATRTINKKFQLFSNHSRILTYCLKSGFTSLPLILWRKQTNAPNKFMGSGMLPANAYVTLEHEYILILRKGSNRIFKNDDEKKLRKESSFFWEERNNWFSDVWHFKGTKQRLNNKNTRKRSGAFPFELAYRLINMFSIKGDIILDPFLGTGTTTLASITSGRNSIGIEINDIALVAIPEAK